MEFTVELDKWWGAESAHLKKDSKLYDLKMKFIEALLEKKIVDKNDCDYRNMTPHIKLTEKSRPMDQSAYDRINGTKINSDALKINPNFIEFNIGYSGIVQSHFTVFYKKNIGDRKKEIKEAFDEFIKSIAENDAIILTE
jgi:hypothetical protein